MTMGTVLIALAPVSIFGIVIFGFQALLNIVVAMATAIATEALFRLVTRRQIRPCDLSAGVTGLLLALVIPPSMPLWMTALGSVFAVIVAKEFFGGLGCNVFNPALVGRAFLMMSFPAAMTTWHHPQNGFTLSLADAVSGASPLGIVATGDPGRFAPSSDSYWPAMKELFFGYHAGSTGETSIMLILAAFLFLLVTRTVDWRAPVSMIVTAAVAAFALGMDPLFSVLSGGLVFGAVYMATDYVTAPVTRWGKVIFGVGAGLLAVLIRKWGVYPEGTSYGILIMNCAVPFLNKLLDRKYGYVPKKKGKGAVGTVSGTEAAK
jgi:electron transport complex protein RnfD